MRLAGRRWQPPTRSPSSPTGLNVAFCLLFTMAVWKGLVRQSAWAFWALSASALVALLAGVGADYVVGTRFPEVNLVSGLLLAAGFSCCAPTLFRRAES